MVALSVESDKNGDPNFSHPTPTHRKLEAPSNDSWATLAATRFLLAAIVMTGHVYCLVDGGRDWTRAGLWWNQGSAVFAFLIISGYSIAASLGRSPQGFVWRRALRIYPLYLASLLVAFMTAAVVGPGFAYPLSGRFHPPTSLEWLACIMMLQSIVAPAVATDGQVWSIAVEWWLYMAAPTLRKLPITAILALAGVSYLFMFLLQTPDASTMKSGGSLLALAWYWLLGFLYYRFRGTFAGYAILILPVIIAYNVMAFVGHAALIGVLAVAFCGMIRLPPRLSKAMMWLGDLSYPLYLLHVPIMILCVHWHVYSSVAICAASLLGSAAALHLIDLPLRTLGRRKSQEASRGRLHLLAS